MAQFHYQKTLYFIRLEGGGGEGEESNQSKETPQKTNTSKLDSKNSEFLMLRKALVKKCECPTHLGHHVR